MLDRATLSTCKEKLLLTKAELLNRVQRQFVDLRECEVGGDEADQAISLLAENQLFFTQQRLRLQLFEIESALMRIDKGTFGKCEETDEPIEPQRLIAIPWTRLSVEGAEIREYGQSRRG